MNLHLGLKFIFTPHALQETTERLFPQSRHRSARVRKKLIKRHGGEFRKAPAMYRFKDTIIAHPSFRARLETAMPQLSFGGNFACL